MIIMIVIIIPLYNNYFWCVDIVFGNLCLFLVISTQINSSCPNNARDGQWGSCWLPTGQLEVTHAPHLQLHSWQSTGELTVNWGVLGQTWANCGQLGWTQANWGEDGKSYGCCTTVSQPSHLTVWISKEDHLRLRRQVHISVLEISFL